MALVPTPRAVRGALAFLTRLPVGGGEAAWDAFRTTPASIPLAGYVLGVAVATPVAAARLLSLPAATAAAAYLLTLYLLAGPTHADGLADVGDAAAVHGDAARRRDVLKDSHTGVGGVLALALALFVVALGVLALFGLPLLVAVAVVVAAEVGAKTGVALLVAVGRPAHEGLGSQLVGVVDAVAVVPVLVVAAPAALLAPGVLAPAAALYAAPLVAVGVYAWARRHLGGASGDVLGAANELGRAVALHAGVVAWHLL